MNEPQVPSDEDEKILKDINDLLKKYPDAKWCEILAGIFMRHYHYSGFSSDEFKDMLHLLEDMSVDIWSKAHEIKNRELIK